MKDIHEFSDIHSHNNEIDENKIINLNYYDDVPNTGYYSIGIHPWQTSDMGINDIDSAIKILEEKAKKDNVAAIGECGIDKMRGGSEEIQKYAFERQIELSEKLCKPLIIHAVRSYDIILSIKKEINPGQQWIIHGFRGKPELAKQLLSKNIGLSYGEKFNKESVEVTPKTLLFSETDQSILDIETIRKRLSITC